MLTHRRCYRRAGGRGRPAAARRGCGSGVRVEEGARLHDGDPRQLGGFRLRARLSSAPEGTVYAAVDAHGEPVQVALLSEGAAGDTEARERFRAAVAEGRGVGRAPRVLASSTRSSAAAWVAVAGDGGRRGAAAYLAPVSGGAGRVRSGAPSLQPHWAARAAPASARWFWPLPGGGGAVASPRANRAVVLGMVLLLLLAVLLAVLLYFWLSMLSQQAGAQAEPSPSPSPSPSSSPSPSPSQEGEERPEDDGESPAPSPSQEPGEDLPSVPLDDDDLSTLPQEPQSLA